MDCPSCNKVFKTAVGLNAHREAKHFDYSCDACRRSFKSLGALDQHIRDSPAHNYSDESTEYDDDWEVDSDDSDGSDDGTAYCEGCNRLFVDKASLYQHLIDSKSFALPSAIAHHIESGGCSKGIDRHRVTAAVHSMGVTPMVSLAHRIQGPSGLSGPSNIVRYSASEQAFNGTSYECYLCHRGFRTLGSLNTHLSSAAHDVDEFKCPKCSVKFKLISSLIQHIETEVCGLARFKQVEDHTSALTAQFSRMLKF
ncbi:hypothetical protein HWV62_3496 [Athelia sp. TMB]|nr:hypothetical protein HWV62_3496 [Athelia sp. TMB]